MYVIDNARIAPTGLPGIAHRTLASGADGLRSLSVWLQTMEPGAATPPHRHDCDEVVVVLAGRGELRVAGEVQAIGADQTIVLPAGVDHQIVNSGDEPLRTLAAFAATPVGVALPDGTPFPLPWAS
ncbi:MAG: cupin domain-containing protein [Burkholderiales bacterium]|jgi:quercetin dioxygenase-like cupin family protein|nr:cupin domain-containing protein [Burkholderiales bacterium]